MIPEFGIAVIVEETKMMKKILQIVYAILGIDGTLEMGSAFLVCNKIDKVIYGALAGGGYLLSEGDRQHHSTKRNQFVRDANFKKLSHKLDFA